MQTETSPF